MPYSVDVVTVCLNSERSIERCLDSVRANRHAIGQYVVVDGRSTDTTLARLERNRDIISTLVSERDRGISDAFNKGIERCTGDFVLLLNADDWLLDGALAQVVESLRPDDDVVSTLMKSFLDARELGVFRSVPEHIPRHNSMLHPGTLVRRTVYEKIGGYDLELRVGMDYDFFCRCYQSGQTFRVIELPLVCFAEGGTSRKLKYRVFKESFRLRKKYFGARLPIYETRQLLGRFVGDALEPLGLKRAVKKLLK